METGHCTQGALWIWECQSTVRSSREPHLSDPQAALPVLALSRDAPMPRRPHRRLHVPGTDSRVVLPEASSLLRHTEASCAPTPQEKLHTGAHFLNELKSPKSHSKIQKLFSWQLSLVNHKPPSPPRQRTLTVTLFGGCAGDQTQGLTQARPASTAVAE